MNRKERRKQKKISAQFIPNQNELLEAIEFHNQKKFDNAKKLYLKVISSNEDNYQALRHLGILYHDIREYQKAIEYLEKAIKIQPLLPDAYNNLGSVYFVNDEIELAKNNYSAIDAKRNVSTDSFDVKVETIGIYSNKELVKTACDIMIKKAKDFVKLINELE